MAVHRADATAGGQAQPADDPVSMALADMVLAGPLLPVAPLAEGAPVASGGPLPGEGVAAARPAWSSRFVFHNRRRFYWKVALLAATTIALVPILLWRHEQAAVVYLVTLAVVHVVGLAIVAVGVKRHDIAPDARGLAIRGIGILLIIGLLYLASKGLTTPTTGAVFWWALFAIWALHTVGLALLHIRGTREQALCPFV